MKYFYLAVDRRAVLAFFNPFKTEQFMTNYFTTIMLLRTRDQHPTKCLRSIYLVLLFQSILQVYLYLFPFQWQHTMLFDVLDKSNNYPNIIKLNISAILLMCVYMFHMLYVRLATEKSFQLFYDYYINDAQTFISTPASRIKKMLVITLNAYQVFALVTNAYLCLEYIFFTLRIFRGDSLPVWLKWIEFASMNCFFVLFFSSICLFIYVSYTCIAMAVCSTAFAYFRFRQTHRALALPYCRFTTTCLLRFVHQNIGTMQFVFSLSKLYGPILLAFLLANLPSNVIIAIYLLQNRFSLREKIAMLTMFIGQLTCFLGVHLMAAAFSKDIHRPYKRIQSLYLRIRRCPLCARIHLANAIQAFHIKNHQYGITYGCGKWTFGLVTMMSFAKFILLYGELLMYQYQHLDRI